MNDKRNSNRQSIAFTDQLNIAVSESSEQVMFHRGAIKKGDGSSSGKNA